MIPLVLDFETFYDKDYSLKKLPTAQYCRDPRFQTLGAGVRLAGGEPVWLEPEALEEFLARVPWDNVLLIGHNLQFDGLVLTERYGYKPKAYACTMFMLRYLIAQGILPSRMGTSLAEAASLVDMEKGNLEAALANDTLGEYATDDAAICGALYDKYWHLLPEDEQGFIDLHVRMAVEPVFRLDKLALQKMADADKSLETLFPLVRKDDQFAATLTALGVNPEYKTTDKGNLKLALAKTDAFMQRLQNHDNEIVRLLADIRLKSRSTIKRSRAQRFLDCGEPLGVPLLYYGQHPGRASGTDSLNMANMTKEGGMRETLLAPPGYELVIVDSEQCQVRVEATIAGQDNLIEAFRRGEDPYLGFTAVRYREDLQVLMEQYEKEEAEGIYGPVSKKRAVQKAAILALGFMQGAQGFLNHCYRNNVPIEGYEEAEEIVRLYRQTYSNHVTLANNCLAEIKQTGEQQLLSGRKLVYPDLRIEADGDVMWRRARIFAKSVNEGWSTIWRGAAVENRVMGEERDIIKWQTMQVPYRVVLMCYDESVFLAREEEAEDCLKAAVEAFSTAPPWMPNLPARGKGRITDCYTK